MGLPETIGFKEAMRRWGVSRPRIQAEIGKGNIKAYRPGKTFHIDIESGDAWFMKSAERAQKSAARGL